MSLLWKCSRLVLGNPIKRQDQFSCWWLDFVLFIGVSIPYSGTYWLVVVDSCLVPSNVSQEHLTFMTKAIWIASADCKTTAFVIFCELYCNPPDTHFTMSYPLWLTSWAKTWPMCRWWATFSIAAHWLTTILTWTCSIFSSVLYMEGHPATGETYATVVQHGKLFIYTTPWFSDTALYPLWLSVYDYFLPLVELWPTKIFITTHCSSLVQMESAATMLILLCQYYSCPSRSKLLHSNPEGSCLYQLTQWAVQPKQQKLKKNIFADTVWLSHIHNTKRT